MFLIWLNLEELAARANGQTKCKQFARDNIGWQTCTCEVILATLNSLLKISPK